VRGQLLVCGEVPELELGAVVGEQRQPGPVGDEGQALGAAHLGGRGAGLNVAQRQEPDGFVAQGRPYGRLGPQRRGLLQQRQAVLAAVGDGRAAQDHRLVRELARIWALRASCALRLARSLSRSAACIWARALRASSRSWTTRT
jgi:hypothetical protein